MTSRPLTWTAWVDRLTMPWFPRWTYRRQRARLASEMMARVYDAASGGRRTAGWRRGGGDANAAVGVGLSLREQARDLIRNNPYATSALDTICDHTVGWGISAAPSKASTMSARSRQMAMDRWARWAETTACDADGRQNFYGLQRQVMRTAVEAGEALVRRRLRRPEDGLPIPMQLQVLEPDHLTDMRDGIAPNPNNVIIQGIEFDPIGRRVAYHMLRTHPGASGVGASLSGTIDRIPASEILHVFKPGRPGQMRGVTWFANVIMRMKDFDDYEDAALLKQKIAACLALVTTDVDGSAPTVGARSTTDDTIDMLEPGMIANLPIGRDVRVVNPPTVDEHASYSVTVLRGIATGLGVTYEDLVGDFSQVNFSSARMGRLKHWARVHDWRWNMLIPQFCGPSFAWAMQVAGIMGLADIPIVDWTPPPMPMIEPDKEGLAYMRNIRIGAMTWPEMVRERGYDPDVVLAEMKEWNAKFDEAGVVLDSDPRKTTQQGGPREPARGGSTAAGQEETPTAPAMAGSNGDGRSHFKNGYDGGWNG